MTSALVLLWSGEELYSHAVVLEYWHRLDFSAALPLYQRCNAIWPQYNQVIQNRKWLIDRWSKEILTDKIISQVVIVAAGMAPLGLDIAARFLNCQVYDLDLINMPQKALLVAGVPGAPENLHFVTADITNVTATRAALLHAGWLAEQPTLMIIEGISYYIPPASLLELLDMPAEGSRVLLEYMVPEKSVCESRRHIPCKIFRAIVDYCGLDSKIEVWTLESILVKVSSLLVRHMTMHDIEKLRFQNLKDSEALFPNPNSGWIEVIDLRII